MSIGTITVDLLAKTGSFETDMDRASRVAKKRAQEIDVARAEAAKRRAEERVAKPSPDMDFERARVALMKSLIRLQVAARARTRARLIGSQPLSCECDRGIHPCEVLILAGPEFYPLVILQ